ncbi:MAG: efflux RND transporter periplasmic adaptor subunit [Planctomycetes bacterium]|nr:efflux RND transporter periplasmic adaptor subunit [Planctomycetota bacterium]
MNARTILLVLRRALVALVFTAITVLLILWLAGAFEEKIDDRDAAATQEAAPGRPAGEAPLAAARLLRVPRIETASGSVEAVRRTVLASRLLSTVKDIPISAGQRVEKGAVLVTLDAVDLEARLEQARAALAAATAESEQARVDFERAEKLREQDVISDAEYDKVKTRLTTAEAQMQRATQQRDETQSTLGYATLLAPFSGVVVDKLVEAGDTVTPGQALLSLYDPAHMQLVANVRESLARRLKVDDLIDVRIDALDLDCQGRISEVVPSADAASRTFEVKVTGPCPPGAYGGMFGRLKIPLDEEEVLVIPRTAVRQVGQMTLVDVAEGGLLRRRAVQLGREFGADVQVLSGLRSGEQVALSAGP